ncbi:MAG: crossover junction endodeoxyribonuclease RuvC [Bacteroidota bacterium]
MRVLGIDPGSVVCGYGVIEKIGAKITLVEYGVIEAKKIHPSLQLRLEAIFTRLQKVVERSLPDEASLESLFYAKNPQSLMKLSHARGVAMLVPTLKQIPVTEYSAREVKRAVTGNGNSSKEQVQFMVRTLLNIEETPEFFDATDALAIAICHAFKAANPQSRARSWKDFIAQNPQRVAAGAK